MYTCLVIKVMLFVHLKKAYNDCSSLLNDYLWRINNDFLIWKGGFIILQLVIQLSEFPFYGSVHRFRLSSFFFLWNMFKY